MGISISTTSSKYPTVHEAAHLVDFALARSLFRGKKEEQIEDAGGRGYGIDLIIRCALTRLFNQGNKDAQEILAELQAGNSNIKSFKDLDLVRQESRMRRRGGAAYTSSAMVLMDSLKKRGFTSRYGSMNPAETFAEAVAKTYEQGEDADIFSKTVTEMAQELLQNPERADNTFS